MGIHRSVTVVVENPELDRSRVRAGYAVRASVRDFIKVQVRVYVFGFLMRRVLILGGFCPEQFPPGERWSLAGYPPGAWRVAFRVSVG